MWFLFPALLLSLFAAFAVATALLTARPAAPVPLLSLAIWWLGWAVAWVAVLLVAGGIVGLGARAVWRLLA